MNRVFWQKLILRGFGPFEHQVSVDFSQHLNLLLLGNETGKTTLVIGLAATLFGLDHHPESPYSLERFYNWNNPERCEGELFFLVGEQHYHLQRLFANDRVRLRHWKGNLWQSVCEGFDHASDTAESSECRSVLRKLLGLDNRTTFLETFCLSQLESETFHFSSDLQNLLSNGARYPEARKNLERRLDRNNSERALLQKEQQQLHNDLQRCLETEQQILHHLERLDELHQRQHREKRRLKQLEEDAEAAVEWQEHADRIQVLWGRQAELELAREQNHEQRAGIHRVRAAMEEQAQQYGLDTKQLEQRLATLTQELLAAQQSEEEYRKAKRGLQRYGVLPLPPDALIPILERRTELLQKQALLQNEDRHGDPPRNIVIILACLIGSAMGALVLFLWGRHHQLAGLLGTALLSFGIDAIAYRLLSHNLLRNRAPKNDNLLVTELKEQEALLGGLGLMDPIALAGCLSLLKHFSLSASSRVDKAQQHRIETELADLREKFSAFRELAHELEVLQQQQRDLMTTLSTYRIDSSDTDGEINNALEAVASEIYGVLSAWRKLCLGHPYLPEAPGRDLSIALQRFQELQEELHKLRQSCAQAEAEETERQQQIAKLGTRSVFNVARGVGRLRELEGKLTELEGDMNTIDDALLLLDRAVAAFTTEHRQELEDRVADYFARISGPREQRLLLDAHWQPRLRHVTDPLASIRLSQGAQDQLRFALRLALADHLSGQSALPLILDDPFANYDAERRERIGEIVRSLAAERQIWLLSHDMAYAPWGKPVVFHSLS